jgi:hypothetical protein
VLNNSNLFSFQPACQKRVSFESPVAHRLYEKTRQTFRRVLCAVPYGYKECLAAEMIAD